MPIKTGREGHRSPHVLLTLALAKRTVALFTLLLAMSFGVFALQFVAPGGVVGALTGGRPVSQAVLDDLRRQHHLDDPILVQYWAWLRRALSGDFGTSYVQNVQVDKLIVDQGLLSLQLAIFAFVIAMIVAIPMATVAAIHKGRIVDRLASSTAILAISVPSFAVALLLLYLFGLKWDILPVFGPGAGFFGRLHHLLLPAIALALGQIGLVVKVTRSALSNALSQDYVTFARSRGVSGGRVLLSYGFRNSMTSITTAAGLTLTTLIVGTVLVEKIFALPGAGSLLIASVSAGDLPVVQALTIVLAAFILVLNLLVDVASTAFDPRVDLSEAV
ncbi:ABC transporter permease [Rhodococcus sp. ARC_M13]|nr:MULTISPECIES: ABC transporter permease [Rhodococcus]MCJ0896506.1 ABC transporter permease [Rhodococcus sp. ARC_M13]UKO87184.1 ABC transporter permease [Rhodococcus erythropolis]